MTVTVPEWASAVVIGGGIIGASVAYHLVKRGWSEVVLLERNQFASGTSWHAAGLIGTMRANISHARLCEYSMQLLDELERETGQSTGFRRVGSLNIAHSAPRFEELRRVASMNNAFGVTRVEIVTVEEIQALHPLLDTTGLLGGSWIADDGHASPIDITNAFIKGARSRGARCLEGVAVTGVRKKARRIVGVDTTAGPIHCDFVVNCAGMWAHALGRLAGVNIPLHACEHYYAHTEKSPQFTPDLPVLRDHDIGAYVREDAGSLLVGAFEPRARAWRLDDIPEDFSFGELEGDVEAQLMPILEKALHRLPALQSIGWRRFFCGPESFTPDDQFHLGPAPELDNYFVACGLNSIGIQSLLLKQKAKNTEQHSTRSRYVEEKRRIPDSAQFIRQSHYRRIEYGVWRQPRAMVYQARRGWPLVKLIVRSEALWSTEKPSPANGLQCREAMQRFFEYWH